MDKLICGFNDNIWTISIDTLSSGDLAHVKAAFLSKAFYNEFITSYGLALLATMLVQRGN